MPNVWSGGSGRSPVPSCRTAPSRSTTPALWSSWILAATLDGWGRVCMARMGWRMGWRMEWRMGRMHVELERHSICGNEGVCCAWLQPCVLGSWHSTTVGMHDVWPYIIYGCGNPGLLASMTSYGRWQEKGCQGKNCRVCLMSTHSDQATE